MWWIFGAIFTTYIGILLWTTPNEIRKNAKIPKKKKNKDADCNNK